VAEAGVGLRGQLNIQLLPAVTVIVDLFAIRSGGEQAAQLFDLRNGRVHLVLGCARHRFRLAQFGGAIFDAPA
jgi:hypothetical protein